MRTLSRYLLRETILTFGFVILAIGITFLFGALARALQMLQGMPLVLVGQFLLTTVGYMSPFLLPTSLLVAVLVAYGRFAGDNELVAVQAAGVRPSSLLLPALVLAVPFTAGCYIALDWLQPDFHRLQRSIQKDAANLILRQFQSRRREAAFRDFLMSWERAEWNETTGATFYNVLLLQVDRNREPLHKLTARQATLRLGEEKLHLRFAGTSILLDRRERDRKGGARDDRETSGTGGKGDGEAGKTGEVLSFEGDFELTYAYDDLLGARRKPLGVSDLHLRELLVDRRTVPPPYPLAEIETEIHERLALAGASLVFVLVGAPLGLLLRRGSRLTAFFVAICVIGFYYALFHFGATFGSRGSIPPTSVWVPDVALFLVGLLGIWRLEHVR